MEAKEYVDNDENKKCKKIYIFKKEKKI